MSTGGPQTPDTALLAQQVDAVAREQAALSAAASRGRAIRLLLLLGLVAVLGITLVKFYKLGDQVLNSEEYHNKVLAELQNHIAANQTAYEGELRQLYVATAPVISDAVQKQVQKDIPVYVELVEKEKDKIIRELSEKLPQRLEKQYADLMARQQDALKKEYPEATDVNLHERLQKNLEKALNNVAKKYYLEAMQKQADAMMKTWDDFPTAPAPQRGQPSLEDQFTGTLVELVVYRFTHPNSWTLNPTATP